MKIQEIKSNQQSKYEEIIKYLKQDDGYWLENDKWDLKKEFFVGTNIHTARYVYFTTFKNEYIKNEIKYYVLFYFKEEYVTKRYLMDISYRLKNMGNFFERYYQNINSLLEIKDCNTLLTRWKSLLLNKNVKAESSLLTCNSVMASVVNFIKDFYDYKEEIEKDIWQIKNIKGVRIPANGGKSHGGASLNFMNIPLYYRKTVKRYFRTIITKKSISHCINTLSYIKIFFDIFYEIGYSDGFIEKLTRDDIEKYLYNLAIKYKDKNVTYANKFISYPRTFLEYIQIAQYDKAPQKEVSFLIFQDDIPKRERDSDRLKRIKFVPEPILKQIDNNIMDLDKPQYIPVYILLRETGWRGTDVLNLRFNNCLEQIWNGKEKQYNYYLCGEITKTGIAQLKIPIRDKVAEMVQKAIYKAKNLSTDKNNPKKYLFNNYVGKRIQQSYKLETISATINRLIREKDIRDANGELYHFKLHSLRHTRCKEYIEQGMGISIIQQIIGHRSLQMTVHYATVTENVLYEKWKNTEDLELFKVDAKTNELEKIELNSDIGENLIRYEYVKNNLDAVRVPFGVCFKPSKLPCKQQMNHCLNCASFCTTVENIPEYEEEIEHVKKQIDISERCGRELWAEKNKQYLDALEKTLEKVREYKLVHKNGKSREDA